VANPFITIITRGYGISSSDFDESLLAPDNIVAVWQPDYRAAMLSWTDTNLTETSYMIFRSENGHEYYSLVQVPPDTTAFLDNIDLLNATKYQYKIYATSDIGYGPAAYSNCLMPRNIDSFPTATGFLDLSLLIVRTELQRPHKLGFSWYLDRPSNLVDLNFSHTVIGSPVIHPSHQRFTWTLSGPVELTNRNFSHIVVGPQKVYPHKNAFTFSVSGGA